MANILVVKDDRLITSLLRSTLEIDGYKITVVLDGEGAVQFALREMPHLVILNGMLTGVDGYELTRRLRSHPKSMHIPVIILSEQVELAIKVRAYEVGVDDYITKPCHYDELLARVRVQLRRMTQRVLSPLTGLPGGVQVEQAIKYNLSRPDPWSVLYLDLDNFKAFNDVYGFLAGNDLIRLVGHICRYIVREHGNVDDFVGHIGGDDFVVMTTPDRAKTLSLRIHVSYKEESMAHYRPEDRERGYISGVDRKGRPYQFPLVSLSIGEVSNQLRQPHSIQEMSYLMAEAKYLAKQSTSNISYTPPRRDNMYQEHAPSALLLSTSQLPPFLSAIGHLHHNLSNILDSEAMAEFEQRVH
ncbi:MAG TPA: response regulator [Ktedonobacteraceae bacterium]|nr:response regulator [Ktedonobacteraceae bacterium]